MKFNSYITQRIRNNSNFSDVFFLCFSFSRWNVVQIAYNFDMPNFESVHFLLFYLLSKTKRKKVSFEFWIREMSNFDVFFLYFCLFLFQYCVFLSKLLCLLKINKIKTKLFVKNEGNARPYIYMIAYHATSEIGFSLWFCGIENSSRELKIIPTYLKRYRLGAMPSPK